MCPDADVLVSGCLGAYITKAPHSGLFRTTSLPLLLPKLMCTDSRADRCAALHCVNYNGGTNDFRGWSSTPGWTSTAIHRCAITEVCPHAIQQQDSGMREISTHKNTRREHRRYISPLLHVNALVETADTCITKTLHIDVSAKSMDYYCSTHWRVSTAEQMDVLV